MPMVQISRLRPGLSRLRGALRILPGPRAAVWPMVLAWVLICCMLALLPGWWVTDWKDRALDTWFQNAHHQAVRLTQEWEHWTAPVPLFVTGSEPQIQAWLQREALVTALVDTEEGRLWIPEGGRLRLATRPEEIAQAGSWAHTAMTITGLFSPMSGGTGHAPRARRLDGGFDAGSWWLVGGRDPLRDKRCSIVTFFGKWCLIKSWVPDSPEAERWLQGTLGSGAPYRFGLVQGYRSSTDWKRNRSIWESSRDFQHKDASHVQFRDPGAAPFRVDRGLSESFGGMWYAVLQMSPGAFHDFWKAYVLHLLIAWTSFAVVVAGSGLALALILFARNREKVLADRLATLTHSLKTPLAILKLRCDTVLNPDLPDSDREVRLLEIQGEVDHLVRTIEAGLEEMRTRYAARSQDLVGPAFFERLDEDYTPAFEAQGRLLEVYGGNVALRCCATVLRSILATLVENALNHGRGKVVVREIRQDGRVRLTVTDEGDGIPAAELKGLLAGKAGPGSQGSGRGEGMGLLVLVQLVRQEGWGLALGMEGATFTARLDLPE